MNKKDFISCFFIVVLWGSSFSFARYGSVEIPPLMMTGLRFLIAGIILIPFAKFPKKEIKNILLISIAIGLEIFCFYVGTKAIDASLVVIAVQTGVPISVFISFVVYKDKISLKQIIGIAISFIGIIYLSGSPEIENIFYFLIVILGAFFWSVANILTKRVDYLKPVALNGYIAFFAGWIFVCSSLLFEKNVVSDIKNATYVGWSSILLLAIMVSAFSDTLWYKLLCKYKVSQVVPFTLLAPVAGVFVGVYFLSESLDYNKLTGGALVVFGLALIEIKKLPSFGRKLKFFYKSKEPIL